MEAMLQNSWGKVIYNLEFSIQPKIQSSVYVEIKTLSDFKI